MDEDRTMMIFCLLLAAISSPAFSGEWKANVVRDLKALVTSCVVVPCSFTHPVGKLPSSRLRGIWHRSRDRQQCIYHEDQTEVLDSFKGRTRLLGHLGQGNCTLEIIKMKDHDNGPFCFRIELVPTTADKFSFVEDCVTLDMLPDAPKPVLTHAKTAIQDHPYTVTCSVIHTCPTHKPNLTWSRGTPDMVVESHRELQSGHWEVQSVLTIVPEEKDDHGEVTCTSLFHGQQESSSTLTLYVKRTTNYNHIIIPAAVAVGTAVIFGVFCILMVKKYKRRIAELQSRDGSLWNRLSRLSRRIHSGGPGPSRSDQRRHQGGVVDSSHVSSHVDSNSCAEQKFSKPRYPSPKSRPKSRNNKQDLDHDDDYMNTADLNVYGNL